MEYSGYNDSREEDFSLARYGIDVPSDEEDESFNSVLETSTPSAIDYILQSRKETSHHTAVKNLVGKKVVSLAPKLFDLRCLI